MFKRWKETITVKRRKKKKNSQEKNFNFQSDKPICTNYWLTYRPRRRQFGPVNRCHSRTEDSRLDTIHAVQSNTGNLRRKDLILEASENILVWRNRKRSNDYHFSMVVRYNLLLRGLRKFARETVRIGK